MPRRVLPAFALLLALTAAAADPPAAELKNPSGPYPPADERKTFRVPTGIDVQLAASEPNVIDPVSMCFDEKGRLFVCEMRGYPNGGVGTGTETRGRIRCLEDKDGDGLFETATTFAEGLRFPMGVQPWKGGLIVAVAPDLIYLEDTDGDGKADKKSVLYTGFNLANIQQMVNNVQWGLDNWIYACAGSDGGTVRSAEKPDAPEVSLRGRGLRFKPWEPASLEATSGGGQYGLSADDAQHWFTATNSQHLRQIILPAHYLRRNPYLPVSATTLDIPEHGAAAKVFRVSEFEAWRVERTAKRKADPNVAKRLPSNELVPGGFVTSGCSPLVYTAGLLPKEYQGCNFVCDPANNLIHCEILAPKGAHFTATRKFSDREFLASTDNWFRPTHLHLGPDGAIYLLDFYREAIETPLSLPDDIKKRMNLESRAKGRIWRIVPDGFKPSKMPDLSKATSAELADALVKDNPWWRLTAQRLLIERNAKDAVPVLRDRLAKAAGKPGRANLLWAIHGLGGLTAADVLPAFDDPLPGNREQALRLAEELFPSFARVRTRAAKLIEDPSSQVRFQLALSAGALPPAEAAAVLAALVAKDGADPWFQTAALSSAADCGPALIAALATDKTALPAATQTALLSRLASTIGAKADEAEIVSLITRIADGSATGPAADAALLDGLGQGMRNSKKPLAAWWKDPPAGGAAAMTKLRARFEKAAAVVKDESAKGPARASAARLLAAGPFEVAAPALAVGLSPTAPGDLQTAAVRSLAGHADPSVSDMLLKPWAGYGPALRSEVLEALLARPDRAAKLLNAIAAKQVSANEIDPLRVQQLKSHPVAAVRNKATEVLKATANADRAKVIAEFTPALELKGDSAKGRGVFKQHCAACHKLDGVGNDVGANLLAALPNKSPADLLTAVLDPNREVDPRYVNYQAVTSDERVLTGIVVVETPTSVTLRRADGAEETVLRANLESLRSTKLSLMPEGFEKQMSKQDVADLFAYLRVAGK